MAAKLERRFGPLLVTCALVALSAGPAFPQSIKASLVDPSLEPTAVGAWTRDLGYDPTELQPLRLSELGIPLVPVGVDGVALWLELDFGTARGFMLTSHAPSVPYREEGRSKELNADGSPRGESIRIRVDSLTVLGSSFHDVEGTLADWRMFSSDPFDGTLGLDFVRGRRVTLDYAARTVAVTARPLPASLDPKRYVSLDLVDAPASQGQIVYARARVNGRDALIYIDTGYNVSFIDPAFAEGLARVDRPGLHYPTFREHVPLEIGGRTFLLDDVREVPISRGSGLELPVALTLGSDVLSHFIVTLDRRAKKLVLGVPR